MKTINLKPNGVGRYDDVSPFIITDRSLELTIQLPAVNGEFYLIAQNNGITVKVLITEDGKITLNRLTAGELCAEVKHYLKGELIHTYVIEPLLLKEVDGTLSAEPEIVAMWRELGAVKETYEYELQTFKSAVEALQKEYEELKAQHAATLNTFADKIDGLMYFAETCIKKIPYIADYKLTEDK